MEQAVILPCDRRQVSGVDAVVGARLAMVEMVPVRDLAHEKRVDDPMGQPHLSVEAHHSIASAVLAREPEPTVLRDFDLGSYPIRHTLDL